MVKNAYIREAQTEYGALHKNFKLVLYCTAQNMADMTEDELRKQLAFFNHYCGCDKVYLEPYRDGLMVPSDRLETLIRVFRENNIEVSRRG
jgi:hypothetical protein